MHRCGICGYSICTDLESSLIINGIPDSTFKISDKTIPLHVINCGYCGSVQLCNAPLSIDYDTVYRSIGVSVSYREEKKQQIKEVIDKYDLYNAKIIEIGAGNGQFLEIFHELGVDIIGIEAGCVKLSYDTNKKHYLYHKSIDEVDEQYDAFFTFHYLEHMPDPVDFVSHLYRILKPGGIGIIEVPGYDYIHDNNLWLEFTKDHRFYYRKRTLQYLAAYCGFEVDSVEEYNEGLCLSMVVKKPNYTPGFSAMEYAIERDVKEFEKMITDLDGQFAIYGAGHYSQLILNLVYNRNKIKPHRIFDSNKQKCGSKILGVIVEHKDSLYNYEGQVIIICGVYNREVYNMLEGFSLSKTPIIWGENGSD